MTKHGKPYPTFGEAAGRMAVSYSRLNLSYAKKVKDPERRAYWEERIRANLARNEAALARAEAEATT
jgi:hypothetical protein